MNDFEKHLKATGEVGYVSQVVHSVCYIEGLPSATSNEVIAFEGGGHGQIISLTNEYAEVLLFATNSLKVGSRVTRTQKDLEVGVADLLLGQTVDPLVSSLQNPTQSRKIYTNPTNILNRKIIDEPLYTGVTMMDLVVPLGRGQRELIIGDRKTGKTELLLQVMLTQSRMGTICVYAAVGKKQVEIKKVQEFLKQTGIDKNTVIVASSASDPAGLIFVSPYTAMTVAEYFRDQGKHVLLILDDMTNHAKAYREVALLAKRFPGRSSYPGDIFYTHSRLIERAGRFKNGTISCFPIAETVMGDLSGYIQTNLMAMTDGHIFLDTDLANLGRRPALNPFLSVTRVGYQAQSNLVRDLSRELNSFLVNLENLRSLLHFGAELSEQVKQQIDLGERMFAFFDQPKNVSMPINVSILCLACIWAGFWKEVSYPKMEEEILKIIEYYSTDKTLRDEIDKRISSANEFLGLVDGLKQNDQFLITKIRLASPAGGTK